MNSKEQRSVAQVAGLFRALGWPAAQIQSQVPPRPDVLVDVDGRRIAVEATDYHGDEAIRGGSSLRKRGRAGRRGESDKNICGAARPTVRVGEANQRKSLQAL